MLVTEGRKHARDLWSLPSHLQGLARLVVARMLVLARMPRLQSSARHIFWGRFSRDFLLDDPHLGDASWTSSILQHRQLTSNWTASPIFRCGSVDVHSKCLHETTVSWKRGIGTTSPQTRRQRPLHSLKQRVIGRGFRLAPF